MQNRRNDKNRKDIIAYGINNGYIELTEDERKSDQIIINKLITAYIYESKRHGFDAAHCVQLRKHIETLESKLDNKSHKAFETYIIEQEKNNHTFYGSYLSDDSDSEEEENFHEKKIVEKNRLRNNARIFQQRAQIGSIIMKSNTKYNTAGKLKTHTKNASSIFDLDERTTIHHGSTVDCNKMQRDLNYLNLLLEKKHTIESAIDQATQDAIERGESFTSFYIAEYRGITHLTTKWNKPSRMANRKDPDEIGKRQYSSSIYKTAGVSLFRQYDAAKQFKEQHPEQFDDPAEELHEILLTFREPRPYSYNNYTYSNLAYLLQNVYSQDYHGFNQLLTEDTLLKSLLSNDANPFFSMGDIPYHACKYAYGLKPYAGYEGDRLRPRWQRNGRAERPYSGVVYASLHPITDFTSDGPLHLVTLNRAAEIKCKAELNILAERESCFPAYLQEDRIFHKHIAKYPSFKGEYKDIYSYKYGMTKLVYEKFQSGFANAAPHTNENRELKKLLGEWICSFYETKLIDLARAEAENRGGVLIYRDIHGKFSLKPPVDSVNRQSNKITTEIKTPVKEKQTLRQSLSSRRKNIQSILTEKSVNTIIGSMESVDDSDSESECASIINEGNHVMSLPLSLMLNAILNKRYRALRKLVTLPEFVQVINETFNSDGLLNITLLHLASARNDMEAVKILCGVDNCNINAKADENVDIDKDNHLYYEEISPFQLAIIRHCHDAAALLLDHKQNEVASKYCSVPGKDLLRGDMLSYPDENDPDDFLGLAWSCRESVPIYRFPSTSALELAKENGNHFMVEKMQAQKLPQNKIRFKP